MLQHRKALLIGVGAGLGLMYLLDPDRGRRRRALIRDRMTSSAHTGADAVRATSRDLGHRATGLVARVRGAFRAQPVDDVVLIERVRSRLGRLISNSHAIEVQATDGVVTLHGPVRQAEMARVVSGVERVSGVREVVNALDPHETAGTVPALQGAADLSR